VISGEISPAGAALADLELSRFGPIGLVVVQSTSLCNLDCDYCYLPDRQKRRVFDLDLLPLLLQRILESPFCGPQLSLVWHAGEPLTLPCSYYDEATAIIERCVQEVTGGAVVIEQHVQTNGTLINDAWCQCFQRNGIVVGVSVDGPAEIHDSHRRFRNGNASHHLTMRGIDALKRHGIPCHVIAVVTAAAMEQPEAMYRFFRDNSITSVGFNVEEQEERYRQFLTRFWQLSEADGHPLMLREFQQVIDLIQRNRRLNQNELNRPYSILSVDWQGNFSTFDPELLSVSSERYGSFNLGNIRSSSLVEAAQSLRFQQLWSDVSSGMERCQSHCDYYGLCGGGMGSNKFWEHGTLDCSETSACRFRTQIPVQVLLDRFEAGPPGDS